MKNLKPIILKPNTVHAQNLANVQSLDIALHRPAVTFFHVPASVISKLASTGPIVSKAELAELKKLQVEYERVQVFLMAHLDSSAKAGFHAQQRNIADRVRSGDFKTVSAADSWTIEDYQQDFLAKRRALKGHCRQISGSAQPIAELVSGRLGERAAIVGREIEAADAARDAEWGLEYTPSKLVQILKYVAAHPKELVGPAGDLPPRKSLVFAGITI